MPRGISNGGSARAIVPFSALSEKQRYEQLSARRPKSPCCLLAARPPCRQTGQSGGALSRAHYCYFYYFIYTLSEKIIRTGNRSCSSSNRCSIFCLPASARSGAATSCDSGSAKGAVCSSVSPAPPSSSFTASSPRYSRKETLGAFTPRTEEFSLRSPFSGAGSSTMCSLTASTSSAASSRSPAWPSSCMRRTDGFADEHSIHTEQLFNRKPSYSAAQNKRISPS